MMLSKDISKVICVILMGYDMYCMHAIDIDWLIGWLVKWNLFLLLKAVPQQSIEWSNYFDLNLTSRHFNSAVYDHNIDIHHISLSLIVRDLSSSSFTHSFAQANSFQWNAIDLWLSLFWTGLYSWTWCGFDTLTDKNIFQKV